MQEVAVVGVVGAVGCSLQVAMMRSDGLDLEMLQLLLLLTRWCSAGITSCLHCQSVMGAKLPMQCTSTNF